MRAAAHQMQCNGHFWHAPLWYRR
ncbi:TPA: hypothetical protein N0F65_012960 [Lagenidium giganteum]|uniref:Uncharacterized protein n=1 Tax=Lagenidium giganteum TaxID=4803 RepID=A0AAV2Z2Z7_9STRA|nr:TPA: hypothetical protein N0F65_012960 [Lagenidium giganteum]